MDVATPAILLLYASGYTACGVMDLGSGVLHMMPLSSINSHPPMLCPLPNLTKHGYSITMAEREIVVVGEETLVKDSAMWCWISEGGCL